MYNAAVVGCRLIRTCSDGTCSYRSIALLRTTQHHKDTSTVMETRGQIPCLAGFHHKR